MSTIFDYSLWDMRVLHVCVHVGRHAHVACACVRVGRASVCVSMSHACWYNITDILVLGSVTAHDCVIMSSSTGSKYQWNGNTLVTLSQPADSNSSTPAAVASAAADVTKLEESLHGLMSFQAMFLRAQAYTKVILVSYFINHITPLRYVS